MTDGIARQFNNIPITKQPRLDAPPFPNLRLPSAFTVAFSCTLEANRGVTRATRRERKREREKGRGSRRGGFLLLLDAIAKKNLVADVGEVSDALQPCSIARVAAPEMTSSDGATP